jgi:YhcH/YjgK/YiaL family protein
MIFDTFDNHRRYLNIALLAPALEFLASADLSALPVGRTDLRGDDLYVLVQEYITRPPEECKWEAHRRYIDVQYVEKGCERMGFAHIRSLRAGEYLPEKDFLPLSGAGHHVDVFAGSFVVFFPEDAHMPGMSAGTPEPVRKIVLKIKIE